MHTKAISIFVIVILRGLRTEGVLWCIRLIIQGFARFGGFEGCGPCEMRMNGGVYYVDPSVSLDLCASLHEAQIRLGVCLVSTNPTPVLLASPPPPPPTASDGPEQGASTTRNRFGGCLPWGRCDPDGAAVPLPYQVLHTRSRGECGGVPCAVRALCEK